MSTTNKLDKIDYLFLNYADTFKRLTPRRQALIKLELAKLFAELENLDGAEIPPRYFYFRFCFDFNFINFTFNCLTFVFLQFKA